VARNPAVRPEHPAPCTLYIPHPLPPPTGNHPPNANTLHHPSISIANKKPKLGDGETAGATEIKDDNEDDDAQYLTSHALSETARVRHKVDITLHARTLRRAHSTTNAASGLCARAAVDRASPVGRQARAA